MALPKSRKSALGKKKVENAADRKAREAAQEYAARLEALRKTFPGGQIPLKDLPPDPVGISVQGPVEIVQATFANYNRGKITRL